MKKKKGLALKPTIIRARMLRKDVTPAEQRLWAALRNRQLNGLKFRRQHPYAQFVLDFFCAERLLAVELDGGIHSDPAVAAHDAARAEFLTQHGIRILRFTNAEVERNLASVLERIVGSSVSPSPDDEKQRRRRERGPGDEG